MKAPFSLFGQRKHAEAITWPPLPTNGFIAGRVAEEADLRAGDAVFHVQADDRRPMEMEIPQFGLLTSGGIENLPVIVVQAEKNSQGEFFGVRDLGGGEHVAITTEVILLGSQPRKF